MITISVCLIVKNEELVLSRCLECAKKIADEIIIVDTGSTDKTKLIAKKYTEKVYDFKWIDDFAAARNFAFSKATKQYCMWLDADDIITEHDCQKILKLKNTIDDSVNIIMLKYNTGFDEDGNLTFSFFRERIVQNNSNNRWKGEIHETIPLNGKLFYSDAAITHKKINVQDPDRNIRIFESIIAKGQKLDARQMYYYARELFYHQKYKEAIDILNVFLNHPDAWIENKIEACQILASCYEKNSQNENVLITLFKSFEYDKPRAEICCAIGNTFINRQEYQKAIFWFKLALNSEMKEQSNGFIQNDCYNFIPYIQLCVCYDKLGNSDIANIYNEKAGQIKPNSKFYIHNKNYFNTIN